MSPFSGSAPRVDKWRHLRLTRQDGVATVTLARPEKLNALTFGGYADLRDLLAELSRERSVRALVLAGEGRGFCSGGDVDEIIGATLAMDTAQLLDFNRMTGQVVRALRECPFPVIAAVHGVAAGSRRGPRAGRRLPGGRPVRPLRLPLHPGRPVRRRHGRGLPAATRRRPRARHPATDAGGARPRSRGRADRTDQRAGGGGPGRRTGRRAGPPPRRGACCWRTRRPRRCSPPSWTCRSPPPSSWTPPPRRCS